MKRKRHTPEQIVRKLREGDRMLNEGMDLTSGSPSLVLFDGLPGSGKTTTSRQVAARDRGTRRPLRLGRRRGPRPPVLWGRGASHAPSRADYDDVCVERWQGLVELPDHPVWLLDGCAMQSTVRFMFEQN